MRLRQTIGLSLALLVLSGGAIAAPADAQDRHHAKKHVAESKAKPVRHAAARHRATVKSIDKTVATAARRHAHARRLASRAVPEDRLLGPVHAIGGRQVGSAAWYGGRHLGRRTASGERLDEVHATAAHRTLPLHSLLRVTNLNNGRSVIVRINDRGPASHHLLVDLSPRAADELDMKRDGIVPVAIEPVAMVADAAD